MENCQGLDDRFQVLAEPSFEAEEEKKAKGKNQRWGTMFIYIFMFRPHQPG
jgi:hypothetical protein